MFADNKNQRITQYAVLAVLLLGLVLYFGYGYGFLAEITGKERQKLHELESKVPGLAAVIAEAEEDGKITQLEYWQIVDAYKETKQQEYKKVFEK